MAKRLFLIGLCFSIVGCRFFRSDEGEVASSEQASVREIGRDAVERALMRLGIDGRVLRIDLNEGRSEDDRMRIAQVHLVSDLVLFESTGDRPRLLALDRNGLDPRWVSELREPTARAVADNEDVVVLVSAHYAHALEKASGRSAIRFHRGDLAGLPMPALKLPFSATGGAAVGNDTFYMPSLGSTIHNKTLESFSLITGQRGWGYRTSGDLLTTPLVGGDRSDPKVYFVTTTGLVTCMDATNYGYAPGGTRWEQLLEAGVRHPLFVTADSKARVGSVFAVDSEGMIYCLNRITGERRWVNATSRTPASGVKVFGDIAVTKMESGLCGFYSEGVMYALHVESGPDAGSTFWVYGSEPMTLATGNQANLQLSDNSVGAGITLEVQGEILSASGDAGMSVNGGASVQQAVLRDGSRVAIGNTVLRVEDRGSDPLWCDLDYDRVIGRVGHKLIAAKGSTMVVVNAWTGEPMGEPVDFSAARATVVNTDDGNVYVVGGDAVVYALFAR